MEQREPKRSRAPALTLSVLLLPLLFIGWCALPYALIESFNAYPKEEGLAVNGLRLLGRHALPALDAEQCRLCQRLEGPLLSLDQFMFCTFLHQWNELVIACGDDAMPYVQAHLKSGQNTRRLLALTTAKALGPKARALKPEVEALLADPDPEIQKLAKEVLAGF